MSGKRSTRGTFVMVKHANKKRNDLSQYTQRTLGTGDLKKAVKLPKGEHINEWIATNIVDFYNEVSVLYDLCSEDAERFNQVGDGFPPNFEYRWADKKNPKPIRCSSPEYVNYVLVWIDEQIHDESLFPVEEDAEFPSSFGETAQKIFTRIFRIYAIIYNSHFVFLQSQSAHTHLNTSFKHFIFFTHEHGMIEEKEFKALEGPVQNLIDEYNK